MILGAKGQAPRSEYTPRIAYSRSRELYDTCLGECQGCGCLSFITRLTGQKGTMFGQ